MGADEAAVVRAMIIKGLAGPTLVNRMKRKRFTYAAGSASSLSLHLMPPLPVTTYPGRSENEFGGVNSRNNHASHSPLIHGTIFACR